MLQNQSFKKKIKILVVDDVAEIRDLIVFALESFLDCEIHCQDSATAAIQHLKRDPRFDLILTDWQMQTSNGGDLCQFAFGNKLGIPLIVLSSESANKHQDIIHRYNLPWLQKPFEISNLVESVSEIYEKHTQTKIRNEHPHLYIPVRLDFLKVIERIRTPLYIKLNDDKFVKMAAEDSIFDDDQLNRFVKKGIRSLFIESTTYPQFLDEYKHKVFAEDAWHSASSEEVEDLYQFNTELLKSLSHEIGWPDEVVTFAQEAIKRCLAVCQNHVELNKVLQKFKQIERFGFADHCILVNLISLGLATDLNEKLDVMKPKLAFASLIHDMLLTDDQFSQKKKYLKMISQKEHMGSRDAREVFLHPEKTALLIKSWTFCPPGVESMILNHHERPDGTGFPGNKKEDQLGPLSAIFVVAEDLAHYVIDQSGIFDPEVYINSRKDQFTAGFAKRAFETLVNRIRGKAAS